MTRDVTFVTRIQVVTTKVIRTEGEEMPVVEDFATTTVMTGAKDHKSQILASRHHEVLANALVALSK